MLIGVVGGLAAPTAEAEPKARLQIRPPSADRPSYGIEHRVARNLEAHGYEIGGRHSFAVTPAITELVVKDRTITCRVAIRVAVVDARGVERWEANRTANVSGRSVLTSATPISRAQRATWSTDCIAAATDDTVTKRVVPFLDGLTRPRVALK